MRKPRTRRRRSWLRRIGTWLLVAAAGYYGQNWFFAMRAKSQFDEQIAALRAAGEPTTTDELPGPHTPDAENAAIPIRAAADLMPVDAEGWALFNWRDEDNVNLDDEERRAAESILTPAEQVTALLRQAENMPSADWQVKFARPIVNSDVRLTSFRQLADFLRVQAIRELDRGNSAGAFEAMRQMVLIVRAMDRYPYAIAAIVNSGLMAFTASHVSNLMPQVRIDEKDPTAASPRDVRAMIALLLDESAINQGFPRAIASDRVAIVQLVDMVAAGELGTDKDDGWYSRMNLHLSRGRFWSEGAQILKESSPLFASAKATDWPSCKRQMASYANKPADDKVAKAFHMFIETMPNSLRCGFEGRAYRRLTAAGLAIHLFAAEHSGRLPASLAALVPAYLPAVPIDPMTQGQPLRYRATGTDPIVYSVGMDGVDDDGGDYHSTTPFNLAKLGEPTVHEYVGDIVFRMTPRPPPRPSTNPEQP